MSLARSLVLFALPVLAAGAVQAQDACGVPPDGRPWGCEVKADYPPSIRPVSTPQGEEINTAFVIRSQTDAWVPVWVGKTCGYRACYTLGTDSRCAPNVPCTEVKVCKGTGNTCTSNSDCNAGDTCVASSTWAWLQMTLSSYGTPKDPSRPIFPENPKDPNIRWGYPGAILRARAETLSDPSQPPGPGNPVVSKGTRIKVKLYNYLSPTTYEQAHTCNNSTYKACGELSYCTGTTQVCTKQSDCAAGKACLPKSCKQDSDCSSLGTTCIKKPVPQTAPNCYHGNNVTNLHFHGTHASPQAPQDFVLLNLYPYGSTGVPSDEYNKVGDYQYDVNPLPWNQPPGTHWYHPHKHGSTSVQVLNGMAGGLIVTGAFDDWLNAFYGGKLVDRVMAVQQISQGVNFFNPGSSPPQPLLNGSATPYITMRPGEVQRWRFVGGTAQASAQLEIGFDPRIKEVRQIAQDGVQFAWQNYDRQPLRDTEGTYNNFKLSPGNRADFLIKAPDTPGTYTVNRRVFIENISETGADFFNIDEESIEERVPPRAVPTNRVPVDFNGNPLLFTIRVEGAANPMSFPVTEGNDPACRNNPKPARCWPATPYYLRDLGNTTAAPVNLKFRIDGQLAAQPNSFWINDSQYQPKCAGVTMALGSTQDWLVANVLGNNNTTLLPHPFHIHTNPFQVRRNADRTFEAPYIWQDTISLPITGTTDRPAGPIWNNEDAKVKCPVACRADNATWNGQWTTTIPGVLSVCGCQVKSDDVAIRHRFDDYTGAYVIHCHFLGHEDRGMMWNVQTVCSPPGSLKYGQTQPGGGADNCAVTKQGFPQCTNTGTDSGHH